MNTAKVKWTGGLRFEGKSKFGLPIATDANKKAGGDENGYSPLELVLFGVAGCTGIDVIRILEKKRQKVTGLEIEVTGYQPEEYPKPFNKVEIKYLFEGENLDPAKIEHALELSEQKYCSVSQTIAGTAEISHTFVIKEV